MAKYKTITNAKILCVDKEAYLSDLLEYVLSQEGFTVLSADSAAQALEYAERHRPDLVLMDVDIPGVDGLTLCSHFRRALRLPVIIVSARHQEEEIIAGFGHGADDYVTKPFSPLVLVHRIQAVVRRSRRVTQPSATARSNYRIGPALFNSAYNEITHNGACVKLTPTEGKILQLLVSCEGQVLPAERIMARVQNFDTQSDVTVIKTHIRNLRIKVARALGSDPIIHTVPGVGYSLRQPLETLERRELA